MVELPLDGVVTSSGVYHKDPCSCQVHRSLVCVGGVIRTDVAVLMTTRRKDGLGQAVSAEWMVT